PACRLPGGPRRRGRRGDDPGGPEGGGGAPAQRHALRGGEPAAGGRRGRRTVGVPRSPSRHPSLAGRWLRPDVRPQLPDPVQPVGAGRGGPAAPERVLRVDRGVWSGDFSFVFYRGSDRRRGGTRRLRGVSTAP